MPVLPASTASYLVRDHTSWQYQYISSHHEVQTFEESYCRALPNLIIAMHGTSNQDQHKTLAPCLWAC